MTEVPVYEFVAVTPLPDARVLVRLDDDGTHPLLVERGYDRGRVLLFTTTIDTDWTLLPQSPRTLVPFVHELLRYAGRPGGASRNASVGETLVAEVDAFPRGMTLAAPDGARRPLSGAPEEIAKGTWRLPPIPSADRAGLWRIEMDGREPVLFGVQLDPAESDLSRMAPNEMSFHPALALARPNTGRVEQDGGGPRRGELWRILAQACLAALILESLWAAWLGHKRRAR